MVLAEPKYQDAVATLITHVLSVPYGTVLTYADLAELLGVPGGAPLRRCVYQANKALVATHRRLLINRRRLGYAIAHPLEQMAHANGRRLKSGRQLRWAQDELEGLDVQQLTAEQRIAYTHLLNRVAGLVAQSRQRTAAGVTESRRALSQQEAALAAIQQVETMVQTLRARVAAGAV